MTDPLTRANIPPEQIVKIAKQVGTPFYLYFTNIIKQQCKKVLSMPNAFGLNVLYAMKANSNKAILKLITDQGLGLDLSKLNEARRAHKANIPYKKMMLTSQEVPVGQDMVDLQGMMLDGLKYNICSQLQLKLIADFASVHHIPLSIRIHPGEGSGESRTRNTGDKYSCFGIHLTNLKDTLKFARKKGVIFDKVHVHIGSGANPEDWKDNVVKELGIIEDHIEYFPHLRTVNFGGGLKEARMPDETAADIKELGEYAKQKIFDFSQRTKKELIMEIEPGTYIIANSGFTVTRVIDIKQTGEDGYKFLVTDGGMELNARPLCYGSPHPHYLVSGDGKTLFSEFKRNNGLNLWVPVGSCCESGDSHRLDPQGNIVPHEMPDPKIGDLFLIGGTGAYCREMSPQNYNSSLTPASVLVEDGKAYVIEKKQTLKQLTKNEEKEKIDF